MLSSPLRLLHPEVPAVTTGLLAVLDIGSHSMNLTVYDVSASAKGSFSIVMKHKIDTAAGAVRTPTGPFSLGKTLRKTLNDAAATLHTLLNEYQPVQVVAMATSVFRDAQDGPAWCAAQKSQHGWLINLIDGTTEATLSALGALSNQPDCHQGVVLDQGGGSMELYNVATGQCTSDTFGVYSLMKSSGDSPLHAAQKVEAALRHKSPWLADTTGDLLLVGRSMRLIGGTLLGEHTRHKTLGRDVMLVLAADLIAGRIPPALLQLYPGYEMRLPYRGAVLQAVLNASALSQVRWADFALREGVFLTQTGKNL